MAVVAADIAVGWHIARVAWGVAGLEEQDRYFVARTVQEEEEEVADSTRPGGWVWLAVGTVVVVS